MLTNLDVTGERDGSRPDWRPDPLTVERRAYSSKICNAIYLSACGSSRVLDDESVDKSIHLSTLVPANLRGSDTSLGLWGAWMIQHWAFAGRHRPDYYSSPHWLIYGRADGIPSSPVGMVVCDG
ncbi:uncharacterized protein LY79DRAFT_572383, partial [Colletotrichum navitas]